MRTRIYHDFFALSRYWESKVTAASCSRVNNGWQFSCKLKPPLIAAVFPRMRVRWVARRWVTLSSDHCLRLDWSLTIRFWLRFATTLPAIKFQSPTFTFFSCSTIQLFNANNLVDQMHMASEANRWIAHMKRKSPFPSPFLNPPQ